MDEENTEAFLILNEIILALKDVRPSWLSEIFSTNKMLLLDKLNNIINAVHRRR